GGVGGRGHGWAGRGPGRLRGPGGGASRRRVLLSGASRRRVLDGDAQQPADASLSVDQLVAEASDGRLDGPDGVLPAAAPTHVPAVQPLEDEGVRKNDQAKKMGRKTPPIRAFLGKRNCTPTAVSGQAGSPEKTLGRARIGRDLQSPTEPPWVFWPASAFSSPASPPTARSPMASPGPAAARGPNSP